MTASALQLGAFSVAPPVNLLNLAELGISSVRCIVVFTCNVHAQKITQVDGFVLQLKRMLGKQSVCGEEDRGVNLKKMLKSKFIIQDL